MPNESEPRAIGLHYLGSNSDGLTARAQDVVDAAVMFSHATPADYFFVSGKQFRPDRENTAAQDLAQSLIDRGIPKDRIIRDDTHPSTTSYEMQHFVNEAHARGIKELVTITSRTHQPTIMDLTPRRMVGKVPEVRVFAYEDILTTFPNDPTERERYEARFTERSEAADEAKWRNYEATKQKISHLPVVGRVLGRVFEQATNLLSWLKRPQVTD